MPPQLRLAEERCEEAEARARQLENQVKKKAGLYLLHYLEALFSLKILCSCYGKILILYLQKQPLKYRPFIPTSSLNYSRCHWTIYRLIHAIPWTQFSFSSSSSGLSSLVFMVLVIGIIFAFHLILLPTIRVEFFFFF